MGKGVGQVFCAHCSLQELWDVKDLNVDDVTGFVTEEKPPVIKRGQYPRPKWPR